MRNVIAHYHTYKNSGTSFDRILQSNYGEGHVSFDGPFPYMVISQREFHKIIANHPEAIAFSSHQIRLPVPASAQLNVLAVAFVRHPFLRIRSVYEFAKRREDPNPSDLWARELDFNGWLAKMRSSRRMVNINNSQVEIYGGVYDAPASMVASGTEQLGFWAEGDIAQAKRNLLTVPLLARTEFFDRDVGIFPKIMAQHGVTFNFTPGIKDNVSSITDGMSLEERIRQIEEELDADNLAWMHAANNNDLALYQFASELIDSRATELSHH